MTYPTPSTTTAADTLFGGRRVLARFKDAARQPQYMAVRALPLSLMPAMLSALEDNAALAALYLDLEIAEVDALHPDTIAEALSSGDEINCGPFSENKARVDARLLRFALALSARKTPEQ